MKKIIFLLFILSNFLIYSETITLSSSVDPNNPNLRNTILLISKAFENLGYNLKIETLPGQRALVQANIGKTDGDIARIAGIEKSYTNLLKVPESIYTINSSMYSLKKLEISTIDELINSDLTVLNVLGTKLIENLLKEKLGKRYSEAPNYESALKMIKAKRADVLINTDVALSPFLEKDEFKNIIKSDKVLIKMDMFIYLNKKHSNLIEALSKELKKLKNQ